MACHFQDYLTKNWLPVLFLSLALLLASLLPLACSLWWSSLLCCDLPYRETHMAKNQERSWDINSLGTEALRPTTCEELNPDINLVSELGSRPFLSWTLRWLQAQMESWVQHVRDPETKDLLKPGLGFQPTETLRCKHNNSVVLSHWILRWSAR